MKITDYIKFALVSMIGYGCHTGRQPTPAKTNIQLTALKTLLDTSPDLKSIHDSNVVKHYALEVLDEHPPEWVPTVPSKDILLSEFQQDVLKEALRNYRQKAIERLRRRQLQDQQLNYLVNSSSQTFTQLFTLIRDAEVSDDDQARADQYLRAEARFVPRDLKEIGGIQLDPAQRIMDLRKYGVITPVRAQGDTKFCWAFAACAAYEGAFQLATGERDIALSEQYIINCSNAGNDKLGGNVFDVFGWMVRDDIKLDDAADCPYVYRTQTCEEDPDTRFGAGHWGFVAKDGKAQTIPEIRDIKEAICRYGPIATDILIDEDFKDYDTTKVYTHRLSPGDKHFNHCVVIIGWNEDLKAWLIKNSMGAGWGSTCSSKEYQTKDRGYMWIDYQSANIGLEAVYIVPKVR